jgi:CO/xanthine dehydrogenase Mo-binding subunit
MWYRFGKSGSLRVETHAALAPDGHFILYCSAPDYGQGINTVMLQLAAETLGIPRDRFELVNADTALTPDSGIQGASRATYFIGSSLCNAVRNLRDEVFGVAAELLDCSPAGLRLTATGRGVEIGPGSGARSGDSTPRLSGRRPKPNAAGSRRLTCSTWVAAISGAATGSAGWPASAADPTSSTAPNAANRATNLLRFIARLPERRFFAGLTP